MQSYRKELWFNVPGRRGFVNITVRWRRPCARAAFGRDSHWSTPCTSPSVFINDDEPGLHQDYEQWLEGLAPHAPTSHYRHNLTGEDKPTRT